MGNSLPDTQAEREAFLRSHGAGGFLEAVDGAGRADVQLLLTIDAFHGEPVVLYVALQYASLEGVSVVMADRPATRQP